MNVVESIFLRVSLLSFDLSDALFYEHLTNYDTNDFLSTDYESSCFSGKYVTGEDINDSYFSKLHDLRNDTAQEQRRFATMDSTGSAALPPGSHHGCENLSNDKRTRA